MWTCNMQRTGKNIYQIWGGCRVYKGVLFSDPFPFDGDLVYDMKVPPGVDELGAREVSNSEFHFLA